jgi:threonyl-tRNA synthetase
VRAGSDSTWDKAEKSLKEATIAAGYNFSVNKGEGAFYGPKLEFVLTDALGREWQCGTLQVDFVLPERLNSYYINELGEKIMPVMLHRAILGSFERFIGILLEDTGGRLPLWLAPIQLVIATITTKIDGYLSKVEKSFKQKGFRIKIDNRNEKINYKIREHSVSKVPIIVVIGEKEAAEHSVNIRRLGEKVSKVLTLDTAIETLFDEVTPPDLKEDFNQNNYI